MSQFFTRYASYYNRALRLEQRGSNGKAAWQFIAAASLDLSASVDRAVAYRQAGINFRLARKYAFSKTAFMEAWKHAVIAAENGCAGAETEQDNITRDWGMLYLDQGFGDMALEMFRRAWCNHRNRGETSEALVSKSFMGRAYAALGQHNEARECYGEAHTGLLDKNAIWCLNNAIWYMRELRGTPRFFLGLTTLELAVTSRYPRRAAEAVVLMVTGERGYDFLRRQVQH